LLLRRWLQVIGEGHRSKFQADDFGNTRAGGGPLFPPGHAENVDADKWEQKYTWAQITWHWSFCEGGIWPIESFFWKEWIAKIIGGICLRGEKRRLRFDSRWGRLFLASSTMPAHGETWFGWMWHRWCWSESLDVILQFTSYAGSDRMQTKQQRHHWWRMRSHCGMFSRPTYWL